MSCLEWPLASRNCCNGLWFAGGYDLNKLKATFVEFGYFFPVLSHLFHIVFEFLVVLFEPRIFGAADDPSVAAVAHLFVSSFHFLCDLVPVHFLFVSIEEQEIVFLLAPVFFAHRIPSSLEVLFFQNHRLIWVLICIFREVLIRILFIWFERGIGHLRLGRFAKGGQELRAKARGCIKREIEHFFLSKLNIITSFAWRLNSA